MRKAFLLSCLALMLFSCGSPVIDGYTDKISYSESDSISIFINSDSDLENYAIDISDINGNYLQSITIDLFPQAVEQNKPYENGFGYALTKKIKLPELPSGVYLIDEKIPFLIKPKKQYDVLILYSSNTENAYCSKGGKSTYGYNSSNKVGATTVSFNRPIGLPFHSADFLKWINQQDLDVGYLSDQDMDDYQNIASAKLLIIPGHSEYWTRRARKNFDRFIDEGNNALILSGNTMWWQVRYDSLENKMICYKNASIDPETNPLLKTVNWNTADLEYDIIGSIGLDFDYGGYGKREDKGWDGYKIVNSTSPLLQGTGIKSGDIIHLPTDEYDGAPLLFSADSTQVSLQNSSNFYKYELIAYDLAVRKPQSNGAWVVMQKSKSSGVIINTGSTDWCRKAGMKGKSSYLIKKLTLNMIDLLMNSEKEQLFTAEPQD